MDNNSLAHTKWNCKYHIVFTPKYRRQIIYKQISADIGQIIRTLCARKGIEIIEAAALPDHIHLYVAIPPKYSVSEIVGYLKGKSSLMIFDRHANLKYKYGNRHFWCRGYYVDTAGKNAKKIAEVEKNFPGFAVDANGIYWKTTKAGNGVKIGGRKNVACEYKGYLVDGRVFDQSAGRGPLEFVTASGQMIPGFDIMVQDMSRGEKRTVVIPIFHTSSLL